jgi:alkanesulfonate monooxygenase SsuD/methylene tetrahydromethanopterin reductase-like flavin-dependent oxidoreductase (luciferase family)
MAFPTTLPKPSYNGYQLAPADQTVRTDMEVGAARQRRRTAARNDQISLTWIFTDAEMAIFRAWFDDGAEAAGGAAWFTGLNLVMGDTGLTAEECRFIGAWSADAMPGLRWNVTAKLEVR